MGQDNFLEILVKKIRASFLLVSGRMTKERDLSASGHLMGRRTVK